MRPISQKMKPVHQAVERYVNNHSQFTVEEVRKGTKKNGQQVRAAINRLIAQGKVEKVCNKRAIVEGKMGRGRPATVYRTKG